MAPNAISIFPIFFQTKLNTVRFIGHLLTKTVNKSVNNRNLKNFEIPKQNSKFTINYPEILGFPNRSG